MLRTGSDETAIARNSTSVVLCVVNNCRVAVSVTEVERSGTGFGTANAAETIIHGVKRVAL